jgi:hypothetical protein
LIPENQIAYTVDVEALGNQLMLYVDKTKIDSVTTTYMVRDALVSISNEMNMMRKKILL